MNKKLKGAYILHLFFCIFVENNYNMIDLTEITIKQYISLLKSGKETDKLKEIDTQLSKALSKFSSGADLSLFMLQKDLLLFECKLVIALYEFDKDKERYYSKQIEKLKKEIERKTEKKTVSTPYQNFLSWILSVEKYLAFGINRNNDLAYLVQATNQMLNFYEQQKQAYEQQNNKRK